MKFIFWRRFDYEKVYLKSKGCSNSIFVAVNLNFAYQIQILYKHKKSTHLEIFIFFCNKNILYSYTSLRIIRDKSDFKFFYFEPT